MNPRYRVKISSYFTHHIYEVAMITVVGGIPVVADGIARENWRESEEGIDVVTGELSRIVKQFSLMLER